MELDAVAMENLELMEMGSVLNSASWFEPSHDYDCNPDCGD